MRKKGVGGLRDYHRSAEFRTIANAALARFNARRSSLPKCGAKRKRDGEPCEYLAMSNGRCRYHGGRTPSGDGWHRPLWPNGNTPNAATKLAKKLQTLERAARKRAARLRRMTEEERAQYEDWHKARPATSAAARAEVKRLKVEGQRARSIMGRNTPPVALSDPEYLAIVARIAALRAEMTALLEDHMNAEQAVAADQITEGVFG